MDFEEFYDYHDYRLNFDLIAENLNLLSSKGYKIAIVKLLKRML